MAFFKFIRVEGCGLPARPKIRVYTYREPNKTRRYWAVAVGEDVLADKRNIDGAKDFAKSKAQELGGLEIVVEG